MHGQARAVHIQGPTVQLTHIQGPTIQTYEGPQGPRTMLLKSGTVPEIRDVEGYVYSYPKSRSHYQAASEAHHINTWDVELMQLLIHPVYQCMGHAL